MFEDSKRKDALSKRVLKFILSKLFSLNILKLFDLLKFAAIAC